MLVNKSYLESLESKLQEKITIWEEQFPKLKFDKWGRALLAPLTGIKEEDCSNLRYASNSFRDAFTLYLESKGYEIRNRYSEYVTCFDSYTTNMHDYVENYFHFKKTDGKLVKIKASKVLAAVQDIWVKDNVDYSTVTKEIKQLREQGATYESSEPLRYYMRLKADHESGNLYVIYQALMNQYNGSDSGIYLSVNPLDLLTSSGNYGDNPTNFGSCWSTNLGTYSGDICITKGSCYSYPKDIIALGKIANRGILYIPNGREVNVPDTEFSLLGYRERTHCWFDTSPHGIWMEKVYPSGYEHAFDKYTEALKDKGIERIDHCFCGKSDVLEFNYNDTEGLEEFEDDAPGIFLDRVAIQDGTLYYLPRLRTDYDYDENIIGLLNDGDYICEDCGDSCDGDIYIDGHGYLCDSCFENYSQCSDCSEYTHNDDLTYAYNSRGYGVYICGSCRDDNYYLCAECEDWHYLTNVTCVDGGDYVCQSCLEDYYFYCEECEEYCKGDSYETDTGEYVCDYCYERYYHTCEVCGNITRDFEEVDGLYYCEDCVPMDCAI